MRYFIKTFIILRNMMVEERVGLFEEVKGDSFL